jgi:fatty acid desaturase
MTTDSSHPHDSRRPIPERVDAQTLRELSQVDPAAALIASLEEWAAIILVIALNVWAQSIWLYLLSVLFIGARQHALGVIAHDASHYRYLPNHSRNDLIANLLLSWPVFASVEGFRRFHGPHHQHTNLEGDGNRLLWKTHDERGALAPEWVYPKSMGGLVAVLVRRGAFVTGVRWILRGIVGPFIVKPRMPLLGVRVLFFAGFAAALTLFQVWDAFFWYWIVPFCTWHITIQYMRLICEHSAIECDEPEYQVTRTTIPTWLESVFILPRNVGYHIEHHWYPSVPFYRLPELHRYLMSREGFSAHANIKRSVFDSLRECIRP